MASNDAQDGAPRTRPRVGLLYTHDSPLTREGEYLAKYIGLTLGSTGGTSKVAVVGVDVNGSSASSASTGEETAVLRADGIVMKASQVSVYQETTDVRVLRDCHVWILCLDTASSFNAIQFLQKRVPTSAGKGENPTPQKRIIVCLQPALRQLRDIENAFPKDTVLHGGACFHMTLNKHSVLYPLSHGCYFIERLPADKTNALYVLDLLEATGFQLLSRKNIQAMKWGHTMIRLFYYLNALTGQTVHDSLRDRAMRLVYLQLLYEMDSLFTLVAADLREGSGSNAKAPARSSWAPDCGASTYLSIHAIMVLLPLPDWIFNSVVSRIVDFGLTASVNGSSTIQRDVQAKLETEFNDEFKDVFDLAGRRDIKLPALSALKNTLVTLVQRNQQTPKLSGRGLLSEIHSTPQSRAVSRKLFVKVIVTLLATVLLVAYFLL